MSNISLELSKLVRIYTTIPEEYVANIATLLYQELLPLSISGYTEEEIRLKVYEIDDSLPKEFCAHCAKLIKACSRIDPSCISKVSDSDTVLNSEHSEYKKCYNAIAEALQEEQTLQFDFKQDIFNDISSNAEGTPSTFKELVRRSEFGHKSAPLLTSTPKAAFLSTKQQSILQGDLPINVYAQTILRLLDQNDILLITAETGSGKSTQLPQLLRAYYGPSLSMVITQPRRISAISLANYVERCLSQEHGKGIVSYSVRFGSTVTPRTQITYVTEGVLLKILIDIHRCARDHASLAQAARYNIFMLDEIHERTVNMYSLLFILRNIEGIKLILCSATAETDTLVRYMESAGKRVANIHIPGRMFHVKEVYYDDIFPIKRSEQASDCIDSHNFIECCVSILNHLLDKQISAYQSGEPITDSYLVFLPGKQEIFTAISMLEKKYNKVNTKCSTLRLNFIPCYSGASNDSIQSLFKEAKTGSIKIVLATNIAETSITITDISVVIDSGYCKQMLMDPETGYHSLMVQRISKAQAIQRKGRAGRLREGIVYRAYTRSTYQSFNSHTDPEILRCNLVACALSFLAAGYKLEECQLLDNPSMKRIMYAYKYLYSLGAISKSRTLTKMGERLFNIPDDPRVGAILLEALVHGVLIPCARIAAALSVLQGDHGFTSITMQSPMGSRSNKHQNLESDHLLLLDIINTYSEVKEKGCDTRKAWVKKHNLQDQKLWEVLQLTTRYVGLLDSEEALNNKVDVGSVEKLLIPFVKTGLYNVLKRNTSTGIVSYSRLDREDNTENIVIHPSSVLHGSSHRFIFCEKIFKTNMLYACICSPVSGKTLALLFPHILETRQKYVSKRFIKV